MTPTPVTHYIRIKSLHLAAYMKAHGAQLTGVEQGSFVFKSNRPVSEWRVAHAASCCRSVDKELIDLRSLLRTSA